MCIRLYNCPVIATCILSPDPPEREGVTLASMRGLILFSEQPRETDVPALLLLLRSLGPEATLWGAAEAAGTPRPLTPGPARWGRVA